MSDAPLFAIPAIVLALMALQGCAPDVNGYRSGPATGSPRQITFPEGPSAVRRAAEAHGVPPALALAVMHVESGGRCAARSSHGALGVMQVLPATARSVGVAGRLTDCAAGAEAGVRYLAATLRAHGPGCAGVSAYNHGIAVRRCTAYGRRVLQLSGRMS